MVCLGLICDVMGERMTAPVLIQVLGGFRLTVGGRVVSSLPRKAQALLAYLAVQDGRPVTRESVSDLLWTDRGAEQARHSLRQTLLVLRREMPDVIGGDARTLSFIPGMVETDVGRFRMLARKADRADLAEAAQVYEDALLDRFPLVAGEFDDWLRTARAELNDQAVEVMRRLVDVCLAASDVHPAILAAERMVALDLLREDSHRRLMQVYFTAGRRADALRQYETCVEVLRRDLDVGPSTETIAAAERARTGTIPIGTLVDRSVQGVAHVTYPQASSGPPWVAILPFGSMSVDPTPGYFATGLVQDMVTMLSALREPIVMSPHYARNYFGSPQDPRSVAHDLGVHYLVTGSVRHAAPWLRISVELTKADEGNVLWAQSFDTKDFSLFDAQDSIARRIVYTIVPRILESELRRVRAKRPGSLTAYDLLLQGRELMYRLDRQGYQDAGTALRQSITLDPGYAPAHAQVADWYALLIGQGWSSGSANDIEACDIAARGAIERDTLNAKALSLHAHIRSFLHRDYASARNLFDVALDAAPNDASTWMWSACTYAYINDATEAVRRAETAHRLSPLDPLAFRYLSTLCIAKYTAGEFEEAVSWGEKALIANPSYTANLRFTIASLVETGEMDRAHEMVAQLMEIQPDFRIGPMRQNHPFRDQDQRDALAHRLWIAGLPE